MTFAGYVKSIENDLINNLKLFRNYDSIKKQQVRTIPHEIHWEDKFAHGGTEICNFFCDYVFRKCLCDILFRAFMRNFTLHMMNLNQDEVFKAL